jgi:hypothetical protein
MPYTAHPKAAEPILITGEEPWELARRLTEPMSQGTEIATTAERDLILRRGDASDMTAPSYRVYFSYKANRKRGPFPVSTARCRSSAQR